MTFDLPTSGSGGTSAILRALGSLMAALGNDEGRAPSRPAASAPSEYVYETRQPATSRSEARAAIPGASAEAAMLLSDARQRAERILQESMERADELLNRERQAPAVPATAEVETLRRSVDELLVAMRDVQARVGRIESILGSSRASAPAAPPLPAAPTPTPARPAFAPPVVDERRAGGLSVVSPQTDRPAPPLPPSAVPPMRGGSQPAASHAPLREEPAPERAVPEPIEAPAAEPWEREELDEAAGTLATFTPADGSVQLRAAPVSGFQGLMRLQDALQRISAVRQATVEAYSQGEARLRLELSADVDSDEIAEGLGLGLGQTAVVQEASEAERSITIAFG